jgi:hypothetical protein
VLDEVLSGELGVELGGEQDGVLSGGLDVGLGGKREEVRNGILSGVLDGLGSVLSCVLDDVEAGR